MAENVESERLRTVLPSREGYLIRPYVDLTGLRDGYFWANGEKGYWRGFLEARKKHFTLQNTGLYIIVSISSTLFHSINAFPIYIFTFAYFFYIF